MNINSAAPTPPLMPAIFDLLRCGIVGGSKSAAAVGVGKCLDLVSDTSVLSEEVLIPASTTGSDVVLCESTGEVMILGSPVLVALEIIDIGADCDAVLRSNGSNEVVVLGDSVLVNVLENENES